MGLSTVGESDGVGGRGEGGRRGGREKGREGREGGGEREEG